MRRHFKHSVLAAIAAISLVSAACIEVEPLPTKPGEANVRLSTHVDDWRDEVIYQIITDRFNDGDINNNFNVDRRSMSRYHGGDWLGIIDRLDYLQDLGVTTVWISPVVKNVEEDAGFSSYHGYWTQDFLKHNPHFGNLAELRMLSDELHKRGMKLILDIVTNHVGQVFFYDINMNGQPDEWLSGGGDNMQGSDRDDYANTSLSRVTEYDPDWQAQGVQAFTSLGLAGLAPTIFFDMPKINRMAPGPQQIDLNGDGQISGASETLGFSNPDWYHKRGRVADWDTQYDAAGAKLTPPYRHALINPDRTRGPFIDGVARDYFQNDQTLFADFPGGLKDIATEREDVRKAMIQVFSYWIDVTDCDGFRIDTLKHVEYGFWESFAPAIRAHAAKRGKKNFFMYGEAFDGNDDLLSAYTQKDMVDSVFLFSQKYAIDQVFKCAPGNKSTYCKGTSHGTSALFGWPTESGRDNRVEKFNNVAQAGGITDSQGRGISPRQSLVNFLDNHDVGRYLFDRNDALGVESLKNALTFILTTNGIPCIYYGTEQGFFGGNDPANREDMWNIDASIFTQNDFQYNYSAPWDQRNPLYTHIKKIISLRNAIPALRRGSYKVEWHSTNTESEQDAGIFAFSRTYEGKSVIVVINTHEKESKRTQGTIGDGSLNVSTLFGSSAQLVDVLDNNYKVSVNNGNVIINVPPMQTRVLLPQADLPKESF